MATRKFTWVVLTFGRKGATLAEFTRKPTAAQLKKHDGTLVRIPA